MTSWRDELKALVDEWKIEADLVLADAERHEMMSELSRVELEVEADTLRRCAKEVRRLIKRRK